MRKASTTSSIITVATSHIFSRPATTGALAPTGTWLSFAYLLAARTVKVWDYHSKSCIQTLEGHSSNVSFAIFHPSLPIIISGSEDGTVKIWHANTYRLENTLSYALERAWCVAYKKGANDVAVGYDEGVVVIQVLAFDLSVRKQSLILPP